MANRVEAIRLAIITTSYPRWPDDDSSIFVSRLVSAFMRHGAGGYVFTPYTDGAAESEAQESFLIERVKYGLFKKGCLAYGAGIVPNIKAKPLLAFQAPLLLLALGYRAFRRHSEYDLQVANWSTSALSAWFNYLISRTPYIVIVRGEDMRLLRNKWLKLLLLHPLRKARAIVSVNDAFLDVLKDDYGLEAEKLACIPNGVTVETKGDAEYETFLKEEGFSADGRYLLFVGTLIPRKRIDILVRLMARPELEGFKLILCGRTTDVQYVSKLKREAEALGCSGRIIFAGAVSPARVPFYYRLARYYVSASAFEGRSNSLLEALAYGKAVIATNIPGHAEVISDGENGRLFPVDDDADSPAALISGLEREPEKRVSLENNARAIAAKFSWERTAEEYFKIFERVKPHRPTSAS